MSCARRCGAPRRDRAGAVAAARGAVELMRRPALGRGGDRPTLAADGRPPRAGAGWTPQTVLRHRTEEVAHRPAAETRSPGVRTTSSERSSCADGADGASVLGDRDALERALTNLVDNALRHGDGTVRDHGAAHRRARERARDRRGRRLRSRRPATLAFERFARGSRARRHDGAGLGLALVSATARAHGGEAHAADRTNGGADVWLDLPAAPAGPAAAPNVT